MARITNSIVISKNKTKATIEDEGFVIIDATAFYLSDKPEEITERIENLEEVILALKNYIADNHGIK